MLLLRVIRNTIVRMFTVIIWLLPYTLFLSWMFLSTDSKKRKRLLDLNFCSKVLWHLDLNTARDTFHCNMFPCSYRYNLFVCSVFWSVWFLFTLASDAPFCLFPLRMFNNIMLQFVNTFSNFHLVCFNFVTINMYFPYIFSIAWYHFLLPNLLFLISNIISTPRV